jgi:hypothetical protein
MSYFLLALPYILQLLCILHIVRHHCEYYWIYIVILVPYVGGVAYLLVEIIPRLGRPRNVGSIIDIVNRTINPSYKIKEYEAIAELTPTFQNKKQLADEYMECGYFDKANSMYEAILVGVHKNDKIVILQRAKALYAMEIYKDANEIIEYLEKEKYEYRNEDEVMVKLKIKENIDDIAKVYTSYEDYKNKYSSFEIYYYFIDYLIRHNSLEQATQEIDNIDRMKTQLIKNRIVFDKRWTKMIDSQKRNIMQQKGDNR